MQYWFSFLDKAGPVGLIIVGISVVALFIVLDRLWLFHRLRIRDSRCFHRVRKRALEGAYIQAGEEMVKERHPLAAALRGIMLRMATARRPPTRIELEKTTSHIGAREIRFLERFLPSLFLISNVAPLLGLFGTVTGMIKAFQTIQNLGGKVDASVLAGGIWEAMMTTALGLGVAIPAMVLHNFLQGKVHKAADELKEQSCSLLDALEDAGCLSAPGAPRLAAVGKPAGDSREAG